MERQLIVLIGPQGSGKTTLCTQFPSFTRISQDEQGNKKHFHLFCDAIKRGDDIILDRTNATRLRRKKYLDIARAASYYTKAILLKTPKETCLERLEKRTGHKYDFHECKIGMFSWFKIFEEPTKEEFNEII